MSDKFYVLPSLSRDDATEIWVRRVRNEKVDAGAYSVSNVIEDDPTLEKLNEQLLVNLRDNLETTRQSYSTSEGICKKSFSSDIDAEVALYVHQWCLELKLDPFQLSHIGFWAWLSQLALDGYFWHFIHWRTKGPQDDREPAKKNWAIGRISDLHDFYFAGAWLRAHKVYDPLLSDPYRFAKMGGTENWKKQILRVEVGWDIEFVRAFLEVIEEGNYSVNAVREKIVPPLRAWTSSANFSNLDFEESKKLIRHLIKNEI